MMNAIRNLNIVREEISKEIYTKSPNYVPDPLRRVL